MAESSSMGLIYLLSFGMMLVPVVFIIVLAWRFMRAHEKIAQALSDISESIKATKKE